MGELVDPSRRWADALAIRSSPHHKTAASSIRNPNPPSLSPLPPSSSSSGGGGARATGERRRRETDRRERPRETDRRAAATEKMAFRAVTTLLRPAAVPVCDGFICLVPMEFSAGFGDNLYLGRLGASNATVPGSGITSAFLAAAMTAAEADFPLLAPIFSESDANCLDLMRATRNFVSRSPYVHSVSMKDIISDASCKLGSPFLGVSAVDTGLLLAEGTAGQSSDATPVPQDVSSEQSSDATPVPQDVSAGQSSDVIQVLKEQLSEVTERAKNLDAENRKLREDVDKAREADNQRSYEIQMEKVRSSHREQMARIEAGKGDKSDNDSGSGKDKKDSGNSKDKKDSGNSKDNKDEETLIKKLLNLLMAPSKAEQFCKDITSNWAKWSSILAIVPVLFGLKQADFLKILSGDLSGIDPRVVVVESRACPCGIPWPEKCSRCGRLLPKFVGDSGLVSFPGVAAASTATTAVTRVTPPQATGVAAAKGDTSTATTAVTKATPPQATGVAAAKGNTSTATTAVTKATPPQATGVAAAKGDTSTATTAVTKATPPQATGVAAAKGDTSTTTTAVTKATPPQATGVAAAKGNTSAATTAVTKVTPPQATGVAAAKGDTSTAAK